MSSINAQVISRETKAESDNYTWVKIRGNGCIGVENVNGATLIPLSRKYTLVYYCNSRNFGIGFFYVERLGEKGVCDLNGKEIISPDRGYTNVDRHDGYFEVVKNGKKGACDLNGKEIISPDRGYTNVDRHDGYFEVVKNGKEGACDLNGKEVVPPQYERLFYSNYSNQFEYKNSSGEWVGLGISLAPRLKEGESNSSPVASSKSSNTNAPSTERESKKTHSTQQTQSDGAAVNRLWTEPYGGDGLGLKVHINMDIRGMKGKKVRVIAYFYTVDKRKLKSQNISPLIKAVSKEYYDTKMNMWYLTSDNQICISEKIKVEYDNAHYNDFVLNIPAWALSPACKLTMNDYYVTISVIDVKSKSVISFNEPFVKFAFGGTDWLLSKMYASNITNKGNITQTREEKYTNYNKYTISYDSGWELVMEIKPCNVCNGTGKVTCSRCGGTGSILVGYSVMPCPDCLVQGNVKCPHCKGGGYMVVVNGQNDRLGTRYRNGKYESYTPRITSTQPTQPRHVTGLHNTWTGTGFALEEGYVVTNYHVAKGAKKILVYGTKSVFNDAVEAQVIATDKINDLALLKINGYVPQQTLPYAIKTFLSEVGEDVWVLGYPLTQTMGQEIKLTTGIINARSGFEGDVALYQISAPIQPGNSGGPVFDKNGNLIGIIRSHHKETQNVNYAIKASYLRNLVESAVNHDILPHTNTLTGKDLPQKTKIAKKFVYYIVCTD